MALTRNELGPGTPLRMVQYYDADTTARHRPRMDKGLRSKPIPSDGADQSFSACRALPDVIGAQSGLTLSSRAENSIHQERAGLARSQPRIPYQHELSSSKFSNFSICVYSSDDMNDFNLIKRTRAKTPVFAVGQLEGKLHTDQAKALGEQYRAVLPIRTLTPCVEQDDPPWPPRKLRKTKCQRNLRDLMKEHSRSSSYSDSETLVGSEPTTPLSATFKCGDIAKQNVNRSEARKMQYAIVPDSRLDTDPPAVKSSMDLLTNELVTALFRQHSPHHDRASSLQVLLMIEAYETAQQHLRHQMHDPHVTDHTEDQLESAERTLEHWLQVLCSVYDRSRENEVTEIVNKDDWPLPLSLKDDFSPPASWDGLTLDIGSQSSLEHLPRKGDGNFI